MSGSRPLWSKTAVFVLPSYLPEIFRFANPCLACRMRDLTGTEPWAWQTLRRHTDRDGGSRIGKREDDVELIESEMDLKLRSL